MERENGMRNMTVGSPAGHIFYFALPLLAGSFLQQLYNMVDSWVVGNYAGDAALAAVGVTVPLLLIMVSIENIFARGAAVRAGRQQGAGKNKEASDTVSSVIGISLIIGVVLCLIGIAFIEPLLRCF